ncbi:MAG: isocitrate lyase/PEP mutase family protein [archaeon]|nr:isocitrate lyase/PEP mutase family protein [archaeon]
MPSAPLKKLLGKEILVVPGCFDPLTARIVQSLGFKATYLGGYAAGAQWCVTEPQLTLTEIVDLSRKIASSVKIPLIVDAGAGYGTPAHVTRTVREFERAGVAAIHIEDQIFPKRFHYHNYSIRNPRRTVHTVSIEEMVAKLKVAVQARKSEDFLIIARTDTIQSHGVKEAIKRMKAYMNAGADIVFPVFESVEQISKITRAAPGTYAYLSGEARPRPYFTVEEARQQGFSLIIYNLAPTYLATNAIVTTYKRLRDTGNTGLNTPEMRKEMDKMKALVEDLINLPEYYSLEKKTGFE